jgi:hypothetical protein
MLPLVGLDGDDRGQQAVGIHRLSYHCGHDVGGPPAAWQMARSSGGKQCEKLQAIYAAFGAQDNLELYVGPEGHRYYKARVWDFFAQHT